ESSFLGSKRIIRASGLRVTCLSVIYCTAMLSGELEVAVPATPRVAAVLRWGRGETLSGPASRGSCRGGRSSRNRYHLRPRSGPSRVLPHTGWPCHARVPLPRVRLAIVGTLLLSLTMAHRSVVPLPFTG